MSSSRAAVVSAALAVATACADSQEHAVPSPSRPALGADAFEGASGDDTPATASAIMVDEVQRRTLFPAGDVDWVAVFLEAGPRYEISADQLSTATDVVAALYAPDGVTTLATGDDYIDLDAEIAFTVATSGTYFVKVMAYDDSTGVSRNGEGSYTLSVHLFVDADGDGVSSWYDCDDGDRSVNPFALDVPGDGIDQDCDGIDALDPFVPDRFEPDNDPSHAKPLAAASGDPGEQIRNQALYAANARTIATGDEDWVTFTAGPHEKIELSAVQTGAAVVTMTVYAASDLERPVVGPIDSFSTTVVNDGAEAQTYYVRYAVTGALFYVPWQFSLGVDLDGDGAFTRDWDDARDCDDGNPAIHPGEAEIPGDGIDSNCNGFEER
jgi:hypothetical protein